MDPRIFDGATPEDRAVALDICDACPFLDNCRAWALSVDGPSSGIVGGLVLGDGDGEALDSPNLCSEPSCSRAPTVAGLCRQHYESRRRLAAPRCAEAGCPNRARRFGRCDRHRPGEVS